MNTPQRTFGVLSFLWIGIISISVLLVLGFVIGLSHQLRQFLQQERQPVIKHYKLVPIPDELVPKVMALIAEYHRERERQALLERDAQEGEAQVQAGAATIVPRQDGGGVPRPSALEQRMRASEAEVIRLIERQRRDSGFR